MIRQACSLSHNVRCSGKTVSNCSGWGWIWSDFKLTATRKFAHSRRFSSERRRAIQSNEKEKSADGLESAPSSLMRPSIHRKFWVKGQPFVDYKRIQISSGKGGDGGISFFKGGRHPVGPPSGGNGGRGASVYIVASKAITSLNSIKNRYIAPNGVHGHGKQMHGADGEDLEIVVPVGTEVRQLDTPPNSTSVDDNANNDNEQVEEQDLSEEEIQNRKQQAKEDLVSQHFKFRTGYTPQLDRIQMLVERIPYQSKRVKPPIRLDLTEDGQRHLLLRGGLGGQGNPHFVSPEIRGPAIAGRGTLGHTMHLELELKTIADAGLVGLPNAGKSTFLAAVSNAHPKIAPYPFTTLNPYVGTIDYPDFWTMTIADIPGLIEGAHRNVGLGHRFLRHVERNRTLIYVVDLAGKAPWEDLEVLKNELEAYKPGLTNKPSLIIANKADIGQAAKDNLEILRQKVTNISIVPVSAKEKKNITKATTHMRQLVSAVRVDEGADGSTAV
ncbi:obg family GTPase CgtA [Phlyctochytrium arcticum]|nr:obg family GTPase CgtA [Phlyctochytrium arcticum]